MRSRLNGYFRILTPVIAALGLAACPADSIDGRFLPSCPAFAGDSVTLENGTFVWDKFTDEVVIDSAGNKVDNFPDHPVKGTYSVDGQRVIFQTDASLRPDFSHWVESGGELYLLTNDEMRQWNDSGAIPRCALIFSE